MLAKLFHYYNKAFLEKKQGIIYTIHTLKRRRNEKDQQKRIHDRISRMGSSNVTLLAGAADGGGWTGEPSHDGAGLIWPFSLRRSAERTGWPNHQQKDN